MDHLCARGLLPTPTSCTARESSSQSGTHWAFIRRGRRISKNTTSWKLQEGAEYANGDDKRDIGTTFGRGKARHRSRASLWSLLPGLSLNLVNMNLNSTALDNRTFVLPHPSKCHPRTMKSWICAWAREQRHTSHTSDLRQKIESRRTEFPRWASSRAASSSSSNRSNGAHRQTEHGISSTAFLSWMCELMW